MYPTAYNRFAINVKTAPPFLWCALCDNILIDWYKQKTHLYVEHAISRRFTQHFIQVPKWDGKRLYFVVR